MKKTRYTGVYLDETTKTYFISTKVKNKITGKFESLTVRGYNSPKEAFNDKARKIIEKTVETSQIGTTFDLMVDNFIIHRSTKLKITSLRPLKQILEKYVIPIFKNIAPKNITVNHLNAYKKSVVENKNGSTSKNKALMAMRQLMDYAHMNDYVSDDINKKCKYILANVKSDNFKKERDFWTKEELNRFLDTFEENDKFKIFFRVLGYCGLRVGEIRGLLWKDFDEANKMLDINKQFSSRTGKGKSEFISLKTKNSYRKVILDDTTYQMLLEFKKETFINEKDFIFFGKKGVGGSKMTDVKNEHYELIKNEQKYIVIHGFRHTCCSLCIQSYIDSNKPVNFLAIAKRLGDTIETVTSVYSHLYPNANEELSDLLN